MTNPDEPEDIARIKDQQDRINELVNRLDAQISYLEHRSVFSEFVLAALPHLSVIVATLLLVYLLSVNVI
jgi:hypothetical protein